MKHLRKQGVRLYLLEGSIGNAIYEQEVNQRKLGSGEREPRARYLRSTRMLAVP